MTGKSFVCRLDFSQNGIQCVPIMTKEITSSPNLPSLHLSISYLCI